MARAKGTAIISALSGNVGGITFESYPGGMVIKSGRRAHPRRSSKALAAAVLPSVFAKLWRDSGTSKQMAWQRYAENERVASRLGVGFMPSGYNLAFKAWCEVTTFDRQGDTSGAFVDAGALLGPTVYVRSGAFIGYPELLVTISGHQIYGVGAIHPRTGYQIHELALAPVFCPQSTPSNRFRVSETTLGHVKGWRSFPALDVGSSSVYLISWSFFSAINWRRGDMYFYRSRVKEVGKWASPYSYGFVYPY